MGISSHILLCINNRCRGPGWGKEEEELFHYLTNLYRPLVNSHQVFYFSARRGVKRGKGEEDQTEDDEGKGKIGERRKERES